MRVRDLLRVLRPLIGVPLRKLPARTTAAEGLSGVPVIGPYPIGVRVLLGGKLLSEGTLQTAEEVPEFVQVAYGMVKTFGMETREMRVEFLVSVDARSTQDPSMVALLSAIRAGGL